jgi:hypothetical protein
MSRLQELQERRAHECRLTPDRALATLDEAGDFLRDRGLLTRTTDSALPSLYEACHEDPYKAGSRGFGSWPATKWPWAGELGQRPGILTLKIHRGKNLLVTRETAAIIDPICRAELERMAGADREWALVLEHLDAAGPSSLDDLKTELGLKPKTLKGILYPLERCGAIVSRQLVAETAGGGHVHTSELARWDQVFPEHSARGGLDDLIVAGVRAAVVAPERELPRWFSWTWLWEDDVVDRLVGDGRLERPEPGWVAAPASA